MAGEPNIKIGEVVQYFKSLNMAAILLTSDIHVGDRIRFTGSDTFSQLVSVLQIEHLQVNHAVKGDTVGLKVKQPVSIGDELIKLIN